MLPSEILGVAPWVIVAAVASWIAGAYSRRDAARDRQDKKEKEAHDQADRLQVHRDELTLSIVRVGREEIAAARLEVEDLRTEVKKLRAMETHFYHFQQSLDHLEALLSATTDAERAIAEKNARAFLNRMRRLQDAKGTIANEAQHVQSEITLLDREDKLGTKGPTDGRPPSP